MTHSGQGDESRHPASRPAHEGVVLPADGSEPFIPGVSAQQVAPAGGSPWGDPWGPGQHAQPLPQEEQPGGGAAMPYAQPAPARALPPQQAQAPYGYGQSGPRTAPAGPDADATQYIAPVVPGAADATQYIAPVVPGAGALPPENPAESTQFLGARPAGAAPAGDAESTQYLPPVAHQNAAHQNAAQQGTPAPPPGAPLGIRPGAPGDRQPPAEFDNLFRSEAGAAGGAEATQYLPPVQEPPHGAQPSYASPGGRASRRSPDSGASPRGASRTSSRLPLIAAVVVGCAVLGLGASALMFGGGGDDEGKGVNTGVAAATSPAAESSEEAADDPAKAQAVELDKLLADSNDSRAAVIRSVESIKTCQNLDQAAADLRGAAEQRRGLVTRLQDVSVDELPDNQALTASLRKAWEASAAADDHYAAWAGQVKEKKGCKGGKARNTGQTAQGNAQSGVATKAKREAATLWNRIATKYDLTERRAEQL
ncbi:hypothetical protein SAMN05444921_11589 [Streptomyces wuyuanensis]|uniref:Uncharacterized protein n=1 Tax=Streptomyces wuyuanensis TaxID=1196353 RepID=A0A1G9X5S8_9ACTN|nr:hypothetical protein [Streptomyces wuyuanensis]SDM92124.1 hypothetical protein SAMN05444921_11589 [Streptomyces wuyuanensis]